MSQNRGPNSDVDTPPPSLQQLQQQQQQSQQQSPMSSMQPLSQGQEQGTMSQRLRRAPGSYGVPTGGGNSGQQLESVGFAASAPLRMDLVDKAIGFLTHPKVQDTPLSRKRDFLREKKGMTDAEIDEAIRRAGVTDAGSLGFIPPSVPTSAPPRVVQDEGWGWASVFAGVVALASLAVAGVYAYSTFSQQPDKKRSKKDKDRKDKDHKDTPAKTPKKTPKSIQKGGIATAVVPKDKEEASSDVATAVAQGVNDDSSKFGAELERLMNLVEENNRQKFELVRGSAGADEGLKADVQTIKQLLLTRQQLGGASIGAATLSSSTVGAIPVKDESPLSDAGVAPNTATPTTSTAPPATGANTPAPSNVAATPGEGAQTPVSAAKPWEVRRRNRLETSNTVNAASIAPLSSVSNNDVPVAPGMIPVSAAASITPVASAQQVGTASHRLGDAIAISNTAGEDAGDHQ